MKHPLSPAQQRIVADQPDWWLFGRWLARSTVPLLGNPCSAWQLTPLWPIRCGEVIVATDKAAMAWCAAGDGETPFAEEFLQRGEQQCRAMRAVVSEQRQRSLAIDWSRAETWESLLEVDFAAYDKDYTKLIADLPNLRVQFAKLNSFDGDSNTSKLSNGLFFRWGRTGGGVILPCVA